MLEMQSIQVIGLPFQFLYLQRLFQEQFVLRIELQDSFMERFIVFVLMA